MPVTSPGLLAQIARRLNPGEIATAALSLGGARALNMLVAFTTVPIALHYLGPQRYGLWMAATSLAFIVINFADGGIANSLITASARAREQGADRAVRGIIASAAVVLIPVAMLVALVALAVAPHVAWAWLFNLHEDALVREAQAMVTLTLVLTAASFPLNIVIKVRTGLQDIPAVAAQDAIGALSSLGALLVVTRLGLSVEWLVAATLGAPLLVKALGAIHFLYRHPAMRPRLSDIDLRCAADLFGGGSVFLVVTLAQALAIQSDQVLIAKFVGPADVAAYSVLFRLYSLPLVAANFLFIAQWPAFAAAASRGDLDWVKRTFNRTVRWVVPLNLLCVALLFVATRPLLAIWVGKTIDPPMVLVLGMAAYAAVVVPAVYCATLLFSLDVRREQIWLTSLMAVVNLPLSIVLIQKIGTAGAIIGTTISYLVCMLLPYACLMPSILKRRIKSQASVHAPA